MDKQLAHGAAHSEGDTRMHILMRADSDCRAASRCLLSSFCVTLEENLTETTSTAVCASVQTPEDGHRQMRRTPPRSRSYI